MFLMRQDRLIRIIACEARAREPSERVGVRVVPGDTAEYSNDHKRERNYEYHHSPAMKQVPTTPVSFPVRGRNALSSRPDSIIYRHQCGDGVHDRQNPQDSRRGDKQGKPPERGHRITVSATVSTTTSPYQNGITRPRIRGSLLR